MSSATSSTCSHKDSKCIAVPNDTIVPGHNFAKLAQDTGNLAQGHMKHIGEDIKLLQQDLPDGVYVRYASERPAFMKCLITGIEGTPYAHGLFEFDLYCPPNYPVSPPKVHFCTTGGNTISFNPNLYPKGFVCLSIIGTWNRTSWTSENNVLGVLISLQACVLNANPWTNEPGQGAGAGSALSLDYNRRLHQHTVRYAMLDWLEKKTYELRLRERRTRAVSQIRGGIWDGVVKQHFLIHKEKVLETVKEWIADRGTPLTGEKWKQVAVMQAQEEPVPTVGSHAVPSVLSQVMTNGSDASKLPFGQLDTSLPAIHESLTGLSSDQRASFTPSPYHQAGESSSLTATAGSYTGTSHSTMTFNTWLSPVPSDVANLKEKAEEDQVLESLVAELKSAVVALSDKERLGARPTYQGPPDMDEEMDDEDVNEGILSGDEEMGEGISDDW